VIIALFSLIDPTLLVRVWLVVQLVLAPLVVLLVVRAVDPSLRWTRSLLPIAMLLSWASLRISLWTEQVTILMLAFGLISVVTYRARPVFAGVALGLCLTKPHILVFRF
jgi:hypothetical protein